VELDFLPYPLLPDEEENPEEEEEEEP